jgi:hypothetical protein
VTAALFPSVAVAASPLHERATAVCDAQLRKWDGTDVYSLSAHQVLQLSKALRETAPALRRGFPRATYARTRALRLQMTASAHRGRIYSRAYRADPSDNSLPQEAAFENSLRRLQQVARAAGLPACSVRLAAQ